MLLNIQEKKRSVFTVYMLAMFSLFIIRYILKISVPAVVFLAVAMIPIFFGSVSVYSSMLPGPYWDWTGCYIKSYRHKEFTSAL